MQRRKIDARAGQLAAEHENAEFASAYVEQIEKIGEDQTQRIERVEQMRQARQRAPQAAQKVIQQSEQQPEQRGGEKLRGLQSQRQLHQPSRRRKKPPLLRSSS